jgi:hypothetical protein
MSFPFVPHATGSVSSNSVFWTDGETPEIGEYDLQGQLQRIFRTGLQGHPVTEEVISAELDRRAAWGHRSREYWAEELSQLPLPDRLPIFKSLQTDEVGWLWAEVYPKDSTQPKEWVVFDLEGYARGTIKTPGGVEVLRIGKDFILGVWKDHLGVEHVHRYALNREPEGRIDS